VSRLVAGQRLPLRPWAVVRDSGPTECSFWERLDIDLLNVPLDEYVARLGAVIAQPAE
jgi:hypothetical protein